MGMSLWEAIVMGVLQGATEFLPVSSSGHLCLAQNIFGFDDLQQYLLFDLVVHLGTLLAVVIAFRKTIIRICVSERVYVLYLAIAVIAFVPAVVVIPFLKKFYDAPRFLGFFFIATAMIIFLGEHLRLRGSSRKLSVAEKIFHAAIIGISQVIALLPGVSRSGTTISVARMLGWSSRDAAEFSFLLAVPMIIAGLGYEVLPLMKGESACMSVSYVNYLAGFISSFGIGLAALTWLMSIMDMNRFKYFSIYCLLLGIFSLVFFNLT